MVPESGQYMIRSFPQLLGWCLQLLLHLGVHVLPPEVCYACYKSYLLQSLNNAAALYRAMLWRHFWNIFCRDADIICHALSEHFLCLPLRVMGYFQILSGPISSLSPAPRRTLVFLSCSTSLPYRLGSCEVLVYCIYPGLYPCVLMRLFRYSFQSCRCCLFLVGWTSSVLLLRLPRLLL